jgi:hypothetical protein
MSYVSSWLGPPHIQKRITAVSGELEALAELARASRTCGSVKPPSAIAPTRKNSLLGIGPRQTVGFMSSLQQGGIQTGGIGHADCGPIDDKMQPRLRRDGRPLAKINAAQSAALRGGFAGHTAMNIRGIIISLLGQFPLILICIGGIVLAGMHRARAPKAFAGAAFSFGLLALVAVARPLGVEIIWKLFAATEGGGKAVSDLLGVWGFLCGLANLIAIAGLAFAVFADRGIPLTPAPSQFAPSPPVTAAPPAPPTPPMHGRPPPQGPWRG